MKPRQGQTDTDKTRERDREREAERERLISYLRSRKCFKKKLEIGVSETRMPTAKWYWSPICHMGDISVN